MLGAAGWLADRLTNPSRTGPALQCLIVYHWTCKATLSDASLDPEISVYNTQVALSNNAFRIDSYTTALSPAGRGALRSCTGGDGAQQTFKSLLRSACICGSLASHCCRSASTLAAN